MRFTSRRLPRRFGNERGGDSKSSPTSVPLRADDWRPRSRPASRSARPPFVSFSKRRSGRRSASRSSKNGALRLRSTEGDRHFVRRRRRATRGALHDFERWPRHTFRRHSAVRQQLRQHLVAAVETELSSELLHSMASCEGTDQLKIKKSFSERQDAHQAGGAGRRGVPAARRRAVGERRRRALAELGPARSLASAPVLEGGSRTSTSAPSRSAGLPQIPPTTSIRTPSPDQKDAPSRETRSRCRRRAARRRYRGRPPDRARPGLARSNRTSSVHRRHGRAVRGT